MSASRKRVVYVFNILSALPAVLVVPLVPFVFFLIDGEGKVPGYLHENAVRVLMLLYPLVLVSCLVLSIRWTRAGRVRAAIPVSLTPLLVFALLAACFYFGGVVLR